MTLRLLYYYVNQLSNANHLMSMFRFLFFKKCRRFALGSRRVDALQKVFELLGSRWNFDAEIKLHANFNSLSFSHIRINGNRPHFNIRLMMSIDLTITSKSKQLFHFGFIWVQSHTSGPFDRNRELKHIKINCGRIGIQPLRKWRLCENMHEMKVGFNHERF